MRLVFDGRNLEAEMLKKNISRKDSAKFLGISYTTINARFNNLNSWQYPECLRIHDEYFPELDLKYLFPHNFIKDTA